MVDIRAVKPDGNIRFDKDNPQARVEARELFWRWINEGYVAYELTLTGSRFIADDFTELTTGSVLLKPLPPSKLVGIPEPKEEK